MNIFVITVRTVRVGAYYFSPPLLTFRRVKQRTQHKPNQYGVISTKFHIEVMLSIFFQYLTAYEILYCLQTASFVLDADGTIGTNELYSAVRVINVKLQFKLCMFHFFPNYINK